jgi:hypothetical protein
MSRILFLLILTGCPFMAPPPEPVPVVVKERIVFVGVMPECAPVIPSAPRKD